MMRKLLPCLLAAGIVALVGCKPEGGGPAGSGPGKIAADDPLTYVPSDTPYVLANIDPVPTEVTDQWIAKVDKNGKVGDMYAEQIDALAKVMRDEGASCGPAAAASGGGGAAMQDASSGSGEADSTATDTADEPASPSSPEVTTGPAAPPVAGMGMGSTDKCSADAVAKREKALKFMDALKAEVNGKDVKGLLDVVGAGTQNHVAFYGIGLVPVLRLELAKPDNLRATIGRLENAAGTKLATGKVGTQDYWIIAGSGADEKIEGVIAIAGKQLVATVAPIKASDADLRTLLGIDKPKKSLAESGDLAAFNKKMNYLTYGSGYFDSAKLVAVLKAPPTPLETSFLTAMGTQKPAIDAVCSGEYDQLAATWPRASFGYTELTPAHVGLRGVLEARADIAKDLMTLRAPMPGLGATQDAYFNFGFSANLVKLPELATKYADNIAKTPWKCPSLANLNQSAEQAKTTLSNPGFAGTAPMFHGFNAIVDKLEFKDEQPMPDIAGVVVIGSDNPAGLLGLAGNMVPGIATMGLKTDGVVKPLPPMPNLPINQPMSAAMTDKVLGLSIGAGEDAKIAAAMKSDPAQQPLAAFGAKGDIYHLIAQLQRKAAKNLGDPEAQKAMEHQAQMMDTYAEWIKHVDVRIELTEQGIELKESVDAK